MTETVAVALVTALSTLAAAGLTGAVTLRLQRRQAAAERLRLREEARRTAYADLLSASTDAWAAVDRAWGLYPQNPDEPRHPEIQEGLAALKRLDQALHVVTLYGPPALDLKAAALYNSADQEFWTIVSLLRTNVGAQQSAIALAEPEQKPNNEARLAARAAFTVAARNALDTAG
ncbi:hypothetical protein ACIREE_40810 [Streptomyces sp. NPDC102467]|uniref:hypothetical protein n=1 Tax=Streptomyces sp. NPDC102467 TaxID=3366179 RepID=UPI003825A4BF